MGFQSHSGSVGLPPGRSLPSINKKRRNGNYHFFGLITKPKLLDAELLSITLFHPDPINVYRIQIMNMNLISFLPFLCPIFSFKRSLLGKWLCVSTSQNVLADCSMQQLPKLTIFMGYSSITFHMYQQTKWFLHARWTVFLKNLFFNLFW